MVYASVKWTSIRDVYIHDRGSDGAIWLNVNERLRYWFTTVVAVKNEILYALDSCPQLWVSDRYLGRHLRWSPWVFNYSFFILWRAPNRSNPLIFGTSYPFVLFFDCEILKIFSKKFIISSESLLQRFPRTKLNDRHQQDTKEIRTIKSGTCTSRKKSKK
jgi:hypothetical protein